MTLRQNIFDQKFCISEGSTYMSETPWVNFINIFEQLFLWYFVFEQLFRRYFGAKNYKAVTLQSRTFQLCNFWHQNIRKKCAREMLMKLTPCNRAVILNIRMIAILIVLNEEHFKVIFMNISVSVSVQIIYWFRSCSNF